jgi:hypothetical protein
MKWFDWKSLYAWQSLYVWQKIWDEEIRTGAAGFST